MVDHKIPLSKGGKDAIENMQITHDICNLNKGSRLAVNLFPFISLAFSGLLSRIDIESILSSSSTSLPSSVNSATFKSSGYSSTNICLIAKREPF